MGQFKSDGPSSPDVTNLPSYLGIECRGSGCVG